MASKFADSRVWFITGSSQGLGRALLEEVLRSNERAVATLRRPEVLADLTAKYDTAQLLVLPLDVTNQAQIVAAFEATKTHFGRLDVVVNNAGYGLVGEIEGTPEEEARKQMEVLFWGPAHVTKEAITLLRDVNPPGHGGRVLNISSTGGYISNPTLSYYSSGKFALEAFTEAFTKEMDPSWNIKGVIIEPGGFRTQWGGSSMISLPIHPAYDYPGSPTTQFRQLLGQGASHAIGDPAKAAKAIMKVASMPDPPLRIQLGTECLAFVKQRAQRTLADAEKYEELAHSTNFDGVDRVKLMEQLSIVQA